jgi:hypothetical protein
LVRLKIFHQLQLLPLEKRSRAFHSPESGFGPLDFLAHSRNFSLITKTLTSLPASSAPIASRHCIRPKNLRTSPAL